MYKVEHQCNVKATPRGLAHEVFLLKYRIVLLYRLTAVSFRERARGRQRGIERKARGARAREKERESESLPKQAFAVEALGRGACGLSYHSDATSIAIPSVDGD